MFNNLNWAMIVRKKENILFHFLFEFMLAEFFSIMQTIFSYFHRWYMVIILWNMPSQFMESDIKLKSVLSHHNPGIISWVNQSWNVTSLILSFTPYAWMAYHEKKGRYIIHMVSIYYTSVQILPLRTPQYNNF